MNGQNKPIARLLNADVRWHGLIGGSIGGVVASSVYSITGDHVSLAMAAGITGLFALGGFIFGLFFEHYNPDRYGNVRSLQFVGACALVGAIVCAVLGAFAAKMLTDDCFAAVRLGKSPVENCREFVGTAVLASGCEILALSVSAGCFCVQMLRSDRAWLKSLMTATFIASFIAFGIVVVLGMLDIGPTFFEIQKYPKVNPKTVLIGGSILGSAMGLLVGLHAALMIAFAPEQQRGRTATPINADARIEFDVFLSHNSHDKPLVRELRNGLSARNLKVWLDEDELRPGFPWQQRLESGIKSSASVAVLVGKDGLGPWEDEEMQGALRLAVREKRPVIPVLLPGASGQPSLPMFLANRTWVDLRNGFTHEGIASLVWGITGVRSDAHHIP
jgi:hypothetical protein